MAESFVVSEDHLSAWRRHNARVQRRNEAAAANARAALPAIVQLLRDDYGATRIILFGSLARGCFTVDSDLDLAVEGIAPARYFSALGEVNSNLPFWVDLKPLEALEPHFLQRVLDTGEELT